MNTKKKFENYKILFFVGFLIFLIPFLAVWDFLKNFLNIVIGISIMIVALTIRSKVKPKKEKQIFSEPENIHKSDEDQGIEKDEEFSEEPIEEDFLPEEDKEEVNEENREER